MRDRVVPRVINHHRCLMKSGRTIELLEYDTAIGIGEDGRATRWDSIVRDDLGRIVDSGAVSAGFAQALLRAAIGNGLEPAV